MGNVTWFLGSLAFLAVMFKAQGMCPRPLPISFATFSPDQQSYQDTERISITCNAGYRNMGEGEARCEGNVWKVNGGRANAPRCVANVAPVVPGPGPVDFAVSCDANCDQANSQCVIYMGARICACNRGYFKHPTEGCVSRASITSSNECGRISCPANSVCGRYRNTACFCNNGYFLVPQMRRCVALPSAPVVRTCSRPSGPNLVVAPAGKTVWTVGQSAVFGCSDGFALSGQRIARCTESGAFNVQVPTCLFRGDPVPTVPTTCTTLSTPANGRSLPIGKTVWNVNEVVSFACNTNYNLQGVSTATCLASGSFTAHNPSCIAIPVVVRATCPSPVVPPNGRINEANQIWREGDRVTYTCNQGFAMTGSGVAVCQSNGQFSNQPPTCGTPQMCSAPVVPFGGMIDDMEMKERKQGDVVRYSCREGFKIYGNPVLTCMGDGTYSSPFPYCSGQSPITTEAPTTQTVTCINPVAPANGFIVGGSVYFVGQAVQVQCMAGYQLSGPSTFFCQSNGAFSQVNHMCMPIVTTPTGCPRPQAPVNGEILLQPDEANKSFWSPGERVLFNCQPRYNLVGVETLLCQDNGMYNADVPICIVSVVVVCPAPILPSLVTISNPKSEAWVAGDTVQFECPLGFEPSRQPASILCQSNGEYSADPPTCVVSGSTTVMCSIASPENGFVIGKKSSANPGELVHFGCSGGFDLVGEPSSVCQFDGVLSSPEPTCEAVTVQPTAPVSCNNPEIPVNGMTVPPGQTSWQPTELIIYECMEGYEMVGLPTRFCQPDGTIFGDVPECMATTIIPPTEPSTCSNPEVPQNAMTIPVGKTTWGPTELIQYECKTGYKLAPGSVALRFCQPDGTIFGAVPVCEAVVDPPETCTPPQPENGYIVPMGQTVFDVEVIFNLACNDGYELKGMERNMCLKGGMLAIELAKCEPIIN